MKSMTGYGEAKLESPVLKANIVMKSWNSRFLEINLQMPNSFSALEKQIKDLIATKIARGKIDLSIRVSQYDMPVNVSADIASASAIAKAIRELAKATNIKDKLSLSNILAFDGIINFERNIDTDALWDSLVPALNACIESFDNARKIEGENTKIDLLNKLDILEKALQEIELVCPEIEANIKKNLRERFVEVMGNEIDEARVLAELASFLAKHTINEEIVRLHSHINAFKNAMNEYSCGKKLDFICQEMNREANTIGSKSADYRVSDSVIRMKDAVENIREQIRNVE